MRVNSYDLDKLISTRFIPFAKQGTMWSWLNGYNRCCGMPDIILVV